MSNIQHDARIRELERQVERLTRELSLYQLQEKRLIMLLKMKDQELEERTYR